MLVALFADVHANLEAFDACLADARAAGADSLVFLGDIVGYGPDPVACVERVAGLVDKGAVAVKGNHDDAAATGVLDGMNPIARASLAWTSARLDESHRRFLEALPMYREQEDRLYVHASACSPADWIYVFTSREAFQSFRATSQRLTFCGHTHQPALFNESPAGLPNTHVPADDCVIPLLAQRRWLAVLGSVGQPRDRNPDACYALLDTTSARLTYRRVHYDIDVTIRKVRAARLPAALSTRLATGT